jgi:hypothetical protein
VNEEIMNDVDPWSKSSVRETLNAMMLDDLEHEAAHEIVGPFLYGEGNFEVLRNEDGKWWAFPKLGFYPLPKPRGIFKMLGIEETCKKNGESSTSSQDTTSATMDSSEANTQGVT